MTDKKCVIYTTREDFCSLFCSTFSVPYCNRVGPVDWTKATYNYSFFPIINRKIF